VPDCVRSGQQAAEAILGAPVEALVQKS
jgi:hypothetical protein